MAALQGKTALIVGGGSPPGDSVAHALAAQGMNIAVADLNPDRVEKVATAITTSGGQALALQGDASNKFQASTLIEGTRDRFGRLDVLIGSAATNPSAPTLTLDEWAWRRTVEMNLTAMFFMAQFAARVMMDEGGGDIVMLLQPLGPQTSTALRATQAGVRGLMDGFALELAGHRVRVTTLPADDTLIQTLITYLTGGDGNGVHGKG